jgi:alkanesulfonate monooxygenase SsuD/methylene tetrahydromethanopterin reductase-like flavin-dependent oxidoreductase (luciferase family)
VAGRETSRIELGTAVTPTYPRHPMAMAQQALTTAQLCGQRFVLGIGLSHQRVVEGMLGLSYAQPVRHMREYLSVLRPLLRGEMVNFEGELYRIANLQLDVPGVVDVPVVVAALGAAGGVSSVVVGGGACWAYVIWVINSRAGRPSRAGRRGRAGASMGISIQKCPMPRVTRRKVSGCIQGPAVGDGRD